MAEFFRSVLEALPFLEQSRSDKQSVAVSDTLSFIESVDIQIHFGDVSEVLQFNESVVKSSTQLESITETINFNEVTYPRVYWRDAFEILSFDENAIVGEPYDDLIFTETLTFVLAKAATDLLEFIEEASCTVTHNLTVVEILTFTEAEVGYKIDTCMPTVQINNHQVTYTCGSDVITLRAPNFQNVEGLEFNVINSQTRGGDMIVFRDSGWPKTKTFNFKYTMLERAQREAVLQFTRRNIGKLVTMVDYEGRSFVGLIRNPDTNATERGRGIHETEIIFETE